MTALALLMIPLVVIQEATTDASLVVLAEQASAAIWVALVLEYVYLLVLADNKRRFVRAHWFSIC